MTLLQIPSQVCRLRRLVKQNSQQLEEEAYLRNKQIKLLQRVFRSRPDATASALLSPLLPHSRVDRHQSTLANGRFRALDVVRRASISETSQRSEIDQRDGAVGSLDCSDSDRDPPIGDDADQLEQESGNIVGVAKVTSERVSSVGTADCAVAAADWWLRECVLNTLQQLMDLCVMRLTDS